MAHAPSLADLFRPAAIDVDKILKGAQPGELPIEPASTFELVINLKTAEALGLIIPLVLLFQANEVLLDALAQPEKRQDSEDDHD